MTERGKNVEQERMRILEMLEQGKITAGEAAELLRAVDGGGPRPEGTRAQGRPWRDERGPHGDRPRWFRVRVTDTTTGQSKANVSIPYGMVNFGLRFAPGELLFGRKMPGGKGPQGMDEMIDALRQGRRGTIYDVTDAQEGKRIEIIVE